MSLRLLLPLLACLLAAACASAPGPMPSLTRLIELEDARGVGTASNYKDGGILIYKHWGPIFGDWELAVARDEGEKAVVIDLFRFLGRSKGLSPIPVMTMDEYADALRKGPAPQPGPPPGDYETVEHRIARMREELTQFRVLLFQYRYDKK